MSQKYGGRSSAFLRLRLRGGRAFHVKHPAEPLSRLLGAGLGVGLPFHVKCVPASFRLGSGGRIDDPAVGGRLVSGTEAEQGLEGGVGGAASVVAKDVLVEVGRQVAG
jgi:hypothetical protein